MSKGVFVYRNLNRKGVVWSVKSNRTGRVIRRSTHIVLRDVEFKVSQAGRLRVLNERRKNVHAGVKGTIMDDWSHEFLAKWRWKRVKYNPYLAGHFFFEYASLRLNSSEMAKKKVERAPFVVLRHDGAWVATSPVRKI